jgi:nitronate monooxygenase
MIKTALTDRFDLDFPIIQAPMAFAAGGQLAGAVSSAGGLGLIGGGYGDADWLDQQFDAAGNNSVGCGFITWSLAKKPDLLTRTLERQPRAIFLSFADPEPFAEEIHAAGVPLIVQVQTLKDAKRAIHCGAEVIVAQGAEAGGHGESRGTMTLVPEVADLISRTAPKTILCAAGGIGDGRGLAASLMLGADGVLVGSRFWASAEANVAPKMHQAAVQATGDHTIRTSVMDIARKLDWPQRYNCRVLKNGFTDTWDGNLDALEAAGDTVADAWRDAWALGDPDGSNTFVGEVTGLINGVKPAAEILRDMNAQAELLLNR